jgi:hypothetical protein
LTNAIEEGSEDPQHVIDCSARGAPDAPEVLNVTVLAQVPLAIGVVLEKCLNDWLCSLATLPIESTRDPSVLVGDDGETNLGWKLGNSIAEQRWSLAVRDSANLGWEIDSELLGSSIVDVRAKHDCRSP